MFGLGKARNHDFAKSKGGRGLNQKLKFFRGNDVSIGQRAK